MATPRSGSCAHCTPLRRAEQHALLTYLSTAPRSARMSWAGLRVAGTMQVGGSRRPLHFLPSEDGAALATSFPTVGEAADLLFRVRGISFRCDATVRRVSELNGGMYLDPAIIEWSLRGFRVGGASFSAVPSEVLLRRPDGRTLHLPLLSISDDELLLLAWPAPRRIAAGVAYPAALALGAERVHGLQIELTGTQAIFTGGQGRILRATVKAGQAGLARVVTSLVREPERRAVVG